MTENATTEKRMTGRIRVFVIAVLCLAMTTGFTMHAAAQEQTPGETAVTQQTGDGDDGTGTQGDGTGTQGDGTGIQGDGTDDPGDGTGGVVIDDPETDQTEPKVIETEASVKKGSSTKKSILSSEVMKLLNCKVSPKKKLKKYKYLYVGASRVHQISKAISDKKCYIYGNPGTGYYWFSHKVKGKEPLLKTIRSYLAARPNGNVIIELGNNDLKNIQKYIALYKELIKRYPKAGFWFVDALPGSGKRAKGSRKNPRRVAFNKLLHKAFPEQCLGGYKYLIKNNAFRTVDGTHYPVNVRKIIYKYVMKQLGRKITYTQKGKKYYVR